jgi:hypothetical protein
MSLSKDNQRGDVFLGAQATPGKPKGLLDAISEIQQYYVVERSGSTIPVDFFTLAGKLAFFEVGFKGGFICGLVSAFLTPVAIGVIEKYLPIFGSYDPTLYDKFFAFLIAVSFTVGYAFFFASLGKYYIGEISKAAIKNLIAGLVSGAILKFVIAFMAFHFIYFIVLEPDRLGAWMLKLTWLIRIENMDRLYQWLGEFRPVFLTSAYFVAFTTFLMVAIPITGIYMGARKSSRVMNNENEWK